MSSKTTKKRKRVPSFSRKKRPAKKAKLDAAAAAAAPTEPAVEKKKRPPRKGPPRCPKCNQLARDCKAQDAKQCKWFVCQEPECKQPVFFNELALDEHLFEHHKGLIVCFDCKQYGAQDLDCTICHKPIEPGTYRRNGFDYAKVREEFNRLKADNEKPLKADKPALAGEFKGLEGRHGCPSADTKCPFVADTRRRIRLHHRQEHEYTCDCEVDGGPCCKVCNPGGFPCGIEDPCGYVHIPACPLEFNSADKLYEHQVDDHGWVRCDTCHRVASNPEALDINSGMCHECRNQQDTWQCPKCDAHNPKGILLCRNECEDGRVCAVRECLDKTAGARFPFCNEHKDKYWYCPGCYLANDGDEKEGLFAVECGGCDTARCYDLDAKCTKRLHPTLEALYEHLRKVHAYLFDCEHCGDPFKSEADCKEHVKRKHAAEAAIERVKPNPIGEEDEGDEGDEEMEAAPADGVACEFKSCGRMVVPKDLNKHLVKFHDRSWCWKCTANHGYYVLASPGEVFCSDCIEAGNWECPRCNYTLTRSEQRCSAPHCGIRWHCPVPGECKKRFFNSLGDLIQHAAQDHNWIPCVSCKLVVVPEHQEYCKPCGSSATWVCRECGYCKNIQIHKECQNFAKCPTHKSARLSATATAAAAVAAAGAGPFEFKCVDCKGKFQTNDEDEYNDHKHKVHNAWGMEGAVVKS